MTMMKINFVKKYTKLIYIFIILISNSLHAQKQQNWIVAAQEFTFTRKQEDSVSKATAKMIPAGILEKLNVNLYREVTKQEILQDKLFELKKERLSLILQLSNETKKRDSIILSDNNSFEYNKQLKLQTKKIQEIKESLAENLSQQKQLESDIDAAIDSVQNNQAASEEKNNVLDEYKVFFKEFFSQKTDEGKLEKLQLYRNDFTALYNPSPTALNSGYNSSIMEKEMETASINAFITGSITSFDEYLSVTVDLYRYPGAQKLCTITEVGSISEADYLCTMISQQIIPQLTNSMPVDLYFEIQNEDLPVNLYIDDEFYKTVPEKITVTSGIHYMQFAAPGYKTVETSFIFKGNNSYSLKVLLEEDIISNIYLGVRSPLDGKIYVNGALSEKFESEKAKIQINGKPVLGQYIADENQNAFFYVSNKHLADENLLKVKLKPIDRNQYIEKRRKWMYGAYSALICSLIPTFVCNGQVEAYTNAYNLDYINEDTDLRTANQWIMASNVCQGISIGCGVWFVYELVRYFIAANSVLPVDAVKEK